MRPYVVNATTRTTSTTCSVPSPSTSINNWARRANVRMSVDELQ